MDKDYLTLAAEARRNKEFDLARQYYERQLEKKGLSAQLLRSVAKLFYLNGQNDASIQYHLASIHLFLYINNEGYKNGDEKIIQLLKEIPEEHENQFKEKIGDILLYEHQPQRHLGHSYFDQDKFFEKQPALKKYADLYYAELLDDGSVTQKMKEHKMTEKDLQERDVKLYIPMGFSLIDQQINWAEINNPDVYQLYNLV